MSDAAELKKLVKQLQPSQNPSDLIAILKTLKQDFTVTEAILRESKAGLAVGKLRQHASKEVADFAKDLVKKWKSQVEKDKLSAGGGKAQPNGKVSSPAGTPTTPTATNVVRTSKSDGVKGGTGDATRDKCVELLYDGLACDANAPIEQILQRARNLEKAVLANLGGTNAEYKSKIRSLFVNLKDKNNPNLRKSVVDGDLSVEELSTMSSREMASDERKNADQKIVQENFHKSLAAGEPQAETDAFQCSRCKQRKCRYRQAQTRSADEPMTTFVTCTNCGNKWKFS